MNRISKVQTLMELKRIGIADNILNVLADALLPIPTNNEPSKGYKMCFGEQNKGE